MKRKHILVAVVMGLLVSFVSAQNSGLTTDFTNPAGISLSTSGNFVIRGSVLVSYTGEEKTVTIPDTLKITEIGESAFAHSRAESVVIPRGVIKIGKSAFASCYSLKTVTLPDTVKVIDEGGFNGCSNLKTLTLPNTLTVIGDDAFYRTGLVRVIIPESVQAIMNDAFSHCSSLITVTLQGSGTALGYGAFESCSKLASITMPNNAVYVSNGAFPHNFAVSYKNSGERSGNYIYSQGFERWYTGTDPILEAITLTPERPVKIPAQGDRETWYRVAIPSGGAMISAFTTGNSDTEIWMYDLTGNQLARDDDSGDNYNAAAATFIQTQTAYIKVNRGWGSEGCSLQVKLE
ncbi:MAG: leucine-rich repeat domain-containing protein [Treponema sp.]|nr:leucine-rich repeat domain-containing protein [Treponema sp.]